MTNRHNIKVSVVVPIYNVEKYIDRCLTSIVNQTLKEIEIILVNDGSTDNSLQVAIKYQKADKRIKIINKKNGGLASARNTGMEEVTGKYVLHVDSDDFYEIDMLEKLYNNAEQNKADIVICGYFTEYINDGYVIDNIVPEVCTSDKNEISDIIYYLNDKGMFNLVWNKLYNSEFIKRTGVDFPEFATTGQDLFFNVELFKHINKISMIKDKLCHYMKYDGETLVAKYHANMYEIAMNRYLKTKELFDFYNMNSEKEKQWLINCYFNNLQNCILNLFRRDCEFKAHTKVNYISEKILKDKYVRKNVDSYRPYNTYSKIFKLCCKLNNSNITYLIYSILFWGRNNMQRVYIKMRKNILLNNN